MGADPGHEVLLPVLDDGGDAVALPSEAEAQLPHVIVGETLDKVQREHRWQAAQNTRNTPFLLHSKSLNILLLKIKMNCVTTQQKSIS